MSQEFLHPVADLLMRYHDFVQDRSTQLWAEMEPVYARFLKDFTDEREEALSAEMVVASDYNIFSILKLHFSEVKAHTPILANLLNPQGSHAQGTVFFKSFVHHCLPTSWQRVAQVRPYQLFVSTEKRNPYGQVDIFLRSISTNDPFAIIIENKINARDQYQQLYRYYQYAKDGLGLNPDQICVVYLSPNGRRPSISGLKEEEQDALELVLAPPIGYHKHIKAMLETAFEKVTSDKVRHTVSQYLQTLKYLPS